MDRVTLESNLHQAAARVMAGQQALREQRAQVRELEQWGLDASMAKGLLRIYEETHAASVLERRRLYTVLTDATDATPLPVQDNERTFHDGDGTTWHRQAA